MDTSPSSLRTASGPRPPAVIVGVQLSGVDDTAFESSLSELSRLADTLGLKIVGRVTQRRAKLAAKAVIGAGKLLELAAYTGGTGVIPHYEAPGKKDKEAGENEEPVENQDEEFDEPIAEAFIPKKITEKAVTVLVDHDLSPSQMRNLEKATGVEVLDRSMVILAIFQRHARTREARLQVEIARLAYTAPRLREAGAGQDRQGGGVGGKGAGESGMELDRRRIRDRIAELKREIEVVKKEADTRRSRRTQTDTNTVALVGYTNAGKSSLMRALTGDEVYVADQLFATLDTTVRALKPETHPRILISDTVGFIKKLPHDLVASFRSTLEEAKDADLLLHLVDGSDPAFRDQITVTHEVLAGIGAGQGPSLMVLNKADRLSELEHGILLREYPEAVIMSAKNPEDVKALRERIVSFFEKDMVEMDFNISFDKQRFVSMLHERCRVLQETYSETGCVVKVRAPENILNTIQREIEGN